MSLIDDYKRAFEDFKEDYTQDTFRDEIRRLNQVFDSDHKKLERLEKLYSFLLCLPFAGLTASWAVFFHVLSM